MSLTRVLPASHRERLEKFRIAVRLDVPQLKLAMAGAPFGWRVLDRALAGERIQDFNCCFLMQWVDRYLPAKPVHDGKAAAAGEHDDMDATERRAEDYGAIGRPAPRR